MELKKLTEENLTRQPEEVFDILCKLGKGSYGSVYKAIHKDSQQILAIKQVPVDNDLQEIIKEISIMQQCDSPYVVKYYGSYFKNTDLWIVMEYCGAGSILDIMKLRGLYWNLPKSQVKPLSEEEIATVLSDTLKGLEYLHLHKKIHRDIKAGNILLNMEGHAKLADFGVSGQLTDTMAKRNTLIGTPFWMAPEIIQEIGYDCVADIWSLGITALEMAEGKAPYAEIHPMRAIFMIPTKPPPSFSQPDDWSPEFIDFVSLCLMKNPESRAKASELLQHEFIKNAKTPEILMDIITEVQETKDQFQHKQFTMTGYEFGSIVSANSGTLVKEPSTIEPGMVDGGTMIQHETLTNSDKSRLVDASGSQASGSRTIEEDLGTMVINEDNDNNVQRPRPEFLNHFDQKDKEKVLEKSTETGNSINNQAFGSFQLNKPKSPEYGNAQAMQQQFQQVPGAGTGQAALQNVATEEDSGASYNSEKFQQYIAEGNLDFVKFLSYNELIGKMNNLDAVMEREIDDLRQRYHTKRQPILDAKDQKRKSQQNF